MRGSRRCSSAALATAIALAITASTGCMANERDLETGELGMELQIAPGVTINTVSWSISNLMTGFSRTGSVNVRFSNTVSFQAGGIPAAIGYTIALSATSTDNTFSCSGSATFSVQTNQISMVGMTLSCAANPPGQGGVIVTGDTQVCAQLDSISASPLETAVDTQVSLAATGSAGTLPVQFAWESSAGSFDDPKLAAPTFTCPSTPQQVTIRVTITPSGPSCGTVTTQTVTVTCSTLNPTFTNVYQSIIGARCTGCHRPGGGGVTVGMLDMSTPAAAYANLVGVNAQGVGGGTSGVTCASAMPALVRVVPNDFEASLLFNKVHSKQANVPVRCGSPMPTPANAPSLTAAQVDLIRAWIAAGAMND